MSSNSAERAQGPPAQSAGRWGGEEFTRLIPETDPAGTRVRALYRAKEMGRNLVITEEEPTC